MSLYFKFVKTIAIVFTIAALLAFLPMAYYNSSSAWTKGQKALYIKQDSNKYNIFFTSMGSLGSQSFVCDSIPLGGSTELNCKYGVIQRYC